MNSIPDKTAKNPVTVAVTVAVTDHVLARAVYTLISVLKKPVAELIRTGLESVRCPVVLIGMCHTHKNILRPIHT